VGQREVGVVLGLVGQRGERGKLGSRILESSSMSSQFSDPMITSHCYIS
jgi:hypothetical protein